MSAFQNVANYFSSMMVRTDSLLQSWRKQAATGTVPPQRAPVGADGAPVQLAALPPDEQPESGPAQLAPNPALIQIMLGQALIACDQLDGL